MSSAKSIIKIIGIIILFYFAAPYLLRAIFRFFHKPQVEVLYETPVAGYITGYYVNRQYYLYYLDGNEKTYYDFNAFAPSLSSPEAHKIGLTKQELDSPGLGAYLKKGDHVSKQAHSTDLTVKRGNEITHWVCSPKQVDE
jgi:hypothetical protein